MTDAILAQIKALAAAPAPRNAPAHTSHAFTAAKGVAVPQKRKAVKHEEDALQVAVIRWWQHQYPEYAGLLFAVPNGGRRDAREGARLKQQGVTAGVADLILLVPRPHILLLELKIKGGKVSDAQKACWPKPPLRATPPPSPTTSTRPAPPL